MAPKAAKKQKVEEVAAPAVVEGAACVDDSKKEGESIPVNTVIQSITFKVKGEEEAMKAEDIVKGYLADAKKAKVKMIGMNRCVCKEFWDMRFDMKFKSVKDLEAWNASETKMNTKVYDELKKVSITEVKIQNFVYDEWKY